jgi:hypothetical protein
MNNTEIIAQLEDMSQLFDMDKAHVEALQSAISIIKSYEAIDEKCLEVIKELDEILVGIIGLKQENTVLKSECKAHVNKQAVLTKAYNGLQGDYAKLDYLKISYKAELEELKQDLTQYKKALEIVIKSYEEYVGVPIGTADYFLQQAKESCKEVEEKK